MIRVSVIIAAYNAQAYIGRAIQSVLNQTEAAFEVLVVDDVSSDGTAAIVLEYAKRNSRVKLITAEENGGPGFARNLGLKAAQGEWIAVLDADDAFLPDRLASLISLAESWDADIVADNLLLRDEEDGRSLGVMFPSEWIAHPRILSAVEFIHGSIGTRNQGRLAYGFMKPVIRRRFLDRTLINYRISRFSEDYIFGLETFLSNAKWLVIPEAYYEYNVRANSLTVNASAADLSNLIAAEKKLLNLAVAKTGSDIEAAMAKHLRSVERAKVWNQFVRALKNKNLALVISLFSSDVFTSLFLTRELILHLPRIFRGTSVDN